MAGQEIAEKIACLEREAGKFVVHAEVVDGELRKVEYAPFGPGDLVIFVWNMRAHLAIASTKGARDLEFKYIDFPEESPKVEEWLWENVYAQGGAMNVSGLYTVVLPLPETVREAIKASLREKSK